MAAFSWPLPQQRGAYRLWFRFLAGILAGLGLTALLHWPLAAPALAQSINQATVIEILDGSQVYIQNQQARVNSVAQNRQRVHTAASRAALRFNTGAIARLSSNSSLTVGQCAHVQQGTLLVNGALNGCTNTSVAGVRGTLYTVTVTEDGTDVIEVFEGMVEVSPRGAEDVATLPKALSHQAQSVADGQSAEPIILSAGQRWYKHLDTGDIAVELLTPEDFETLLLGPLVAGFVEELPGLDALQASFESLFPDIPFPGVTPSVPTPAIPTPAIPGPFSF
ncbi:MAG: FecR domain-containing protein [Leptolyngbya sp. RL_3_1]|nr:FecR domain-containing protein [Leptolyngbya sp. RL_3_1]